MKRNYPEMAQRQAGSDLDMFRFEMQAGLIMEKWLAWGWE
jgi:hypothetical protein